MAASESCINFSSLFATESSSGIHGVARADFPFSKITLKTLEVSCEFLAKSKNSNRQQCDAAVIASANCTHPRPWPTLQDRLHRLTKSGAVAAFGLLSIDTHKLINWSFTNNVFNTLTLKFFKEWEWWLFILLAGFWFWLHAQLLGKISSHQRCKWIN